MHIGNRLRLLRAILSAIPGLSAILLGNTAHAQDDIAPGHILVRLRFKTSVADLCRDYGTTLEDVIPGTTIYSLSIPAGMSEEKFAGLISQDKRVLYAEADPILEAPEAHGDPFHLPFDRTTNSSGYVRQSGYAQVNAQGTGGASEGGSVDVPPPSGPPIIVAVLDTGITASHPALQGRLLTGYNAINPADAPLDLPDGLDNLAVGHGTMVAGIIARLAPGARILPVRVLDGDGNGSLLTVAKGLFYAVRIGRARVINMSFGTHRKSSVLSDALDAAEAAGVVLVAAAGNEGLERDQYPAKGNGAIAVTSVDSNNIKSLFANYGSFIRVVAPGESVCSTYWDGGYARWSGTSFAAPFVAGEAAILLSARPDLTVEAVKSAIRSTAHPVDGANPAYKGRLGKGLVDFEAALRNIGR